MAILPSLRFAPFQLIAVCDLDADLAAHTARTFGADKWYANYREMLDREELDVVAVVGPPSLHFLAGKEVLASGRHLFVEKPPAPTVAEAEELAAAASGREIMVGFQKRHARAYVLARNAAQEDSFGQVSMLRMNYSHVRETPLSDHLAFMSIHAIDLASFFMGDVSGGALHVSSHEKYHVVAATFEHVDGGISMLSLSALEPRLQETVELAGQSSLLRVSDLSELIIQHQAPEWADTYDTGPAMASVWRPDFAIPIDANNSLVLQGYAGEMSALAAAIHSGTTPQADIHDAVKAMRIIDLIAAAPPGFSTFTIT
jgi:myo-inositol 2-dehydrogenase/D-chiro-inositol 1-dehydrogenase